MSYGNEIKADRLEKGLTQKQLGTILGVSQEAVRKWENGGDLRAGVFNKLLTFFGQDSLTAKKHKAIENNNLLREAIRLVNENKALMAELKAVTQEIKKD